MDGKANRIISINRQGQAAHRSAELGDAGQREATLGSA